MDIYNQILSVLYPHTNNHEYVNLFAEFTDDETPDIKPILRVKAKELEKKGYIEIEQEHALPARAYGDDGSIIGITMESHKYRREKRNRIFNAKITFEGMQFYEKKDNDMKEDKKHETKEAAEFIITNSHIENLNTGKIEGKLHQESKTRVEAKPGKSYLKEIIIGVIGSVIAGLIVWYLTAS